MKNFLVNVLGVDGYELFLIFLMLVVLVFGVSLSLMAARKTAEHRYSMEEELNSVMEVNQRQNRLIQALIENDTAMMEYMGLISQDDAQQEDVR